MSGRSKFYALDVSDDLSRSGSSCSNEEQEQERLSGLDVSLSSSIDPSLKSSILPLIPALQLTIAYASINGQYLQ